MLGDLEAGVDNTDTKLSGAMQRMKKFVRQTEGQLYLLEWSVYADLGFLLAETKSGWCIVILIIVLIILLVAVILF